jgi:hypothetical protein
MRIVNQTKALAFLAAATLLVATQALANPPDYLLLKRCRATYDEVPPQRFFTWQISSSFVSIQNAAGGGALPARHTFEFDTYAFCNGPNGYAEYGTGDDVCMGRAADLPGTLVYSAVTTAPDAASGQFSLTESPSPTYNAWNYAANLNVNATINGSFNLAGATVVTLTYYHHHALIWNASGDQGRAEVSTDGGANWTTVKSHPYYLGDFGQFKRTDVNLSGYAGQTIRLRFRFQSNSSAQDNGWNIDDVRLTRDGATLFFDDFETGTDGWTLDAPWALSDANNSYVLPGGHPGPIPLGTINASSGVYSTTPVVNPVVTGEGMGYAAIRASYTEGPTTRNVYTHIHHTAPQYKGNLIELGYDNLCPVTGTCAVNAVESGEAPERQAILEQNSPNPFNPSTAIGFVLPESSPVSLKIYDEAGRVVRVLLSNQTLPSGDHIVNWNGMDGDGVAARSGVYFYELQVNDRVQTRKMVLVK